MEAVSNGCAIIVASTPAVAEQLSAEEAGRVDEWLAHPITRADAEEALAGDQAAAGSYCLRQSSDGAALCVLCVLNAQYLVRHYRVMREGGGGAVSLADGGAEGTPSAASLYALLALLKGRDAAGIGLKLGDCISASDLFC